MTGRKLKIQGILVLICLFIMTGCGKKPVEDAGTQVPNDSENIILAGPGSYDSADTALITRIDDEEKTITFLNLDLNKKYTLSYDGTTVFTDRFGEVLSISQIKEGDLADITFLKSRKTLTTLQMAQNAWTNESVSRYVIDSRLHNITIGNDIYRFSDTTRIFSQGKEVEFMDLNAADILTFRGIGSNVYSIVVEKGHGYLKLSGDENFIGGWIEVGQNQIHQITEEMLLVVPEGTYQVLFSTVGGNGTKKVTIKRNEEVTVDISDLTVEAPQFGQIVFAMIPADAALYVDGEKVDTGAPVSLQYGIHQLIAKAEGYDTTTSYLKVGSPSAGIEIELEKKGSSDTEDDEEEEDISSGNSSTTATYYRMHIESPTDVEVYVDGNYVGISPVSIRKTSGPHVITLRKSGYETRSYTVQVDDEEKDISYSFVPLEAE